MKQNDTAMVSKPIRSIFEPLTPEQQAQLAHLDAIPDEEIDLTEIPELTDSWFQRAKPLSEVFPKVAEAVEQARLSQAGKASINGNGATAVPGLPERNRTAASKREPAP